MTKTNPPETWGSGKSTLPLFEFLTPPEPPNLTPRERRAVDALREVGNEGILSFQLREVARCSYVPALLQCLEKKSFRTRCNLEPYLTADGLQSTIGRYFLVSEG